MATIYQWAVIGAGPAGIASVGKLLDNGIQAKDIVWIDPNFTVGDFGTRWRNVPSNTKVELFLKFLYASDAFDFKNCQEDFALKRAPVNKTCELRLMADPLQWVTHHLKEKVHAIQDIAETLKLDKRTWQIKLRHAEIQATNVILANGAEPKNLPLSAPPIIPLHIALDSENIKTACRSEDTIAVFGSSHSAVLILRNLIENCSVKRIVNFYQDQLLYAVYLNDWILFDDTGLKGPTAEWSRENLHGNLPDNLIRLHSNEENIEHYLPQCDKVIYAVGFNRRTLPVVDELAHMKYIEQTGIIAPGLFGLGIAFPEAKYNPFGMVEYRVGLWKFMDYLNRIMPVWLNYAP